MQILLVEDDDVAVESVLRGMKKCKVNFPITVAENGQVALDILQGNHPTKKLQTPFVVLLDINMPILNGFEFLEIIRADSKLKKTVVFVLSTSSSDVDKTRAYDGNIAGYMVKDKVGPQFSKLFALLNDYAEAVALPSE